MASSERLALSPKLRGQTEVVWRESECVSRRMLRRQDVKLVSGRKEDPDILVLPLHIILATSLHTYSITNSILKVLRKHCDPRSSSDDWKAGVRTFLFVTQRDLAGCFFFPRGMKR